VIAPREKVIEMSVNGGTQLTSAWTGADKRTFGARKLSLLAAHMSSFEGGFVV